jgi:hypothetical protein
VRVPRQLITPEGTAAGPAFGDTRAPLLCASPGTRAARSPRRPPFAMPGRVRPPNFNGHMRDGPRPIAEALALTRSYSVRSDDSSQGPRPGGGS